ncbi:MAG: DotU family type IV/VI secretion system protein, partial [Arenicella sp.]|nr:DotU family type IV/VI secretion system protein [Arenicella sp.]
MTTDDPFFGDDDSDRTVLKPTPGGRRSSAPKPSTPQPPPPRTPAPGGAGGPPRRASAPQVVTPGLNPLVDSASALLALAGQLKNSVSHPDPGGLNQHVAAEIKQFEETARQRGCKPESVLAGRY